ncbi:hypothetical protein KY341_02255, partial [Candidatus Woesearchaeota archaeon]|nr:hypothetical protein [Candidatus Woesearchaeota archaeon]
MQVKYHDVLKKIKKMYIQSDDPKQIDKICSLIISRNENPELLITHDALKNLIAVYLNHSVHYKKFEDYLKELLGFIFRETQEQERCLNCNNLLFRAFASKQNIYAHSKIHFFDAYCLNC